MVLARQPETEAVVTEFLDRLFLWLGSVFPRMTTRLFLSAFVDRNHELPVSARIHVRLQDAAKYLAETTETIIAGIRDGSIDGFSGIDPVMSRLFWSNHEMYRVTFKDYQRLKEKNLNILLMLATARHMAGIDPNIQNDDPRVDSIMEITGELVTAMIMTPAEELLPDVCMQLSGFARQALVAFEREALLLQEDDRQTAAELDSLSTMIRNKLVLIAQRIAAGVNV